MYFAKGFWADHTKVTFWVAPFTHRCNLRSRVLSFLFLLVFACAMVAAPGVAHANPKYAAIVVDADTGKVLHEAHADATRHPASLTKMMTLYMTFEALKAGRLRMNQYLTASSRAASMPQTNISLKRGNRIKVKDAIRALVVRSANDVAVVLAEALGKTEWQFAVAMTNKARQLGMRKTVFRNASGLPDVRQITTARDMATLSLALRRDFPEYYHFFKESSFSYRGRKYNGHNHVLTRMQGVDGLKTGYINMSGFNLASSIKRNGYSLVAVVLGGRTAKRRDNHMVNLLGRSLRQIASIRPPIKNTQFVRGNTPVPVLKPGSEPIQVTDVAIPVANPRRADETVQIANHAVPPVTAGIAAGTPRGWGIQVGAYADSQDAFFAAVNAMNVASRELQGSEITVSDPNKGEGRIYRARIANITEAQARRACRVLLARKEACFVYRDSSS